jgi:hypothetical protein
MKMALSLHRNLKREFSSAGSEHLPYKQRVGGSNPSTPTKVFMSEDLFLFSTFDKSTTLSKWSIYR